MSKDTLKVEKDIERSLERLKITFNQANPASSLIPPFFYSVFSLLSRPLFSIIMLKLLSTKT